MHTPTVHTPVGPFPITALTATPRPAPTAQSPTIRFRECQTQPRTHWRAVALGRLPYLRLCTLRAHLRVQLKPLRSFSVGRSLPHPPCAGGLRFTWPWLSCFISSQHRASISCGTVHTALAVLVGAGRAVAFAVLLRCNLLSRARRAFEVHVTHAIQGGPAQLALLRFRQALASPQGRSITFQNGCFLPPQSHSFVGVSSFHLLL